MATTVKRMTEADRAKITTEIQKRAKALAILAFHATDSVDINTLSVNQRLAPKTIRVNLNMKSKSHSSWAWSTVHADWEQVPSTNPTHSYLYRYPSKCPQHDIVVERTKAQFPKCSSIPDESLSATVSGATPEEIEWANGVLENMGITEETGDYHVEFQTSTKVRRTIYVQKALNPGHAQLMALKALTANVQSGWAPLDKIDPNEVDIFKVEKNH